MTRCLIVVASKVQEFPLFFFFFIQFSSNEKYVGLEAEFMAIRWDWSSASRLLGPCHLPTDSHIHGSFSVQQQQEFWLTTCWSLFISFAGASSCFLKAEMEHLTDEKEPFKNKHVKVRHIPSPLRNLFTPLGSGSEHESRYSATRVSKSPVRKMERQ